MKKAISKLIAAVLLLCVIMGNIPAGAVYGAESGQPGDIAAVSSEDNQEVPDTDGVNDQEDIPQDNSQAIEEQPGETDTYPKEQIEENELHYIYIESPYLETPAIQRIVFSFETAFAENDRISITVLS